MVFLAGLWVEVVPVFEALSAGAGSWSMSLSSGVRAISRRFSDNGLKRRTLCRRPWHRSERGLTSNEDRQYAPTTLFGTYWSADMENAGL